MGEHSNCQGVFKVFSVISITSNSVLGQVNLFHS